MSEEKVLVEGLYPKEGKVDFVKEDEWINIDVLVSKQGKWYCAENTFKPKPKENNAQVEGDDDNIPF